MGNSCCNGLVQKKDIEVPQNIIQKDENVNLIIEENIEEEFFNSNYGSIQIEKGESPETNMHSIQCKGSFKSTKSKLCLDRVTRSKQRLRNISDKEVRGFKSNFFKQKFNDKANN